MKKLLLLISIILVVLSFYHFNEGTPTGNEIDYSEGSVMDAYHDTLKYLKNSERVMILYLDGFGYHQYEYAIENGYAPFLEKSNKADQVTTVYEPVTNAGFAAMITGKPPSENGVHSRKEKDLKVISIFGQAQKLNKKALLVEGNIKILNTEIEPLLNIDKNKDGFTDDEVFEKAQKNIQEYDLIMVHFHGIDDCGHKYGDLAKKTMERIKIVDGYVEQLVLNWEGRVIITSDHGMHKTEQGGSHGEYIEKDLLIPYLITEGMGNK